MASCSSSRTMAGNHDRRAGAVEGAIGGTVARYRPSGTRPANSGARYRSVSSEPRAKERLQERKTRCSSATRAKKYSEEGGFHHQSDINDPALSPYTTDSCHPQGSEAYRQSNNYQINSEYQHLYQTNLYSQQQVSTTESYQPPLDSLSPRQPCGFQSGSYAPNQDLDPYHHISTLPSAEPSYQQPHDSHFAPQEQQREYQLQPLYQSPNLPATDSYKGPGPESPQRHPASTSGYSGTNTLSQSVDSVPARRGTEYGYQVTDLDGLLTQSSAAHPANLPMVINVMLMEYLHLANLPMVITCQW